MRKALVKDQIAAEIRCRIRQRVYAPGCAMPTQRELAREFRTSRTAVSLALADVERAGLIEQAPSRGTCVLPLDRRPPGSGVAIVSSAVSAGRQENDLLIDGARAMLTRSQQHWHLVLSSAFPQEQATADRLMRLCAGALFIEGLGYERVIEELERRHFPCVVANLEKSLAVSATWVDHGKSTRTAVRMLAALGHRQIALLIRPPEMFFYGHVLEAYREALGEAGITFDDRLVIQSSGPDAAAAVEPMRVFLNRRPQVSALVAARDYLAAAAWQTLQEKGIEPGRDVSVIGFDDITWPEGRALLTTFREPAYMLGATAAEMLIERLIAGWVPVTRRETEAPLALRRSVGLGPEFGDRSPPSEILFRTAGAELSAETAARAEPTSVTATGPGTDVAPAQAWTPGPRHDTGKSIVGIHRAVGRPRRSA